MKISKGKSELTGKKSKRETMYLSRWERASNKFKDLREHYFNKRLIIRPFSWLYSITLGKILRRRRYKKKIKKLPPTK